MISALVFTGLLSSQVLMAEPSAPVSYGKIKPLLSNRSVELAELTRRPSLGLIFKADCSACHRQIRDLQCLEDRYNIYLLGAFSKEKQLREEYLKTSMKYPAFWAPTAVIKKLGIDEPLTPQLIFFKESQLISKYLGYRPCAELAKLLSEAGPHE